MELQKCWCLLITVLIAGFVCSSDAYTFYVGGGDGWTLHPAEDYNQWSARMRFSVHDSLVFKYKNGTDSVLVVNEEDYNKCNVQNPIKKLEGGESVFVFDRSGPFFFISGNGTNCNQGQKLRITVISIKTPPPPQAPISPPSKAPAPAPIMASTPSSPSPATAPAVSPMSPSSPASSPTYTPSMSPSSEKSTPVPSPSASGNSPPADNTPAAAPGPQSDARRMAVSPEVLAVAGLSVVLSLAFGSVRINV